MKKLLYLALSVLLLSSCHSTHLSLNKHYNLNLIKREVKAENITSTQSHPRKAINTLPNRKPTSTQLTHIIQQHINKSADTCEKKTSIHLFKKTVKQAGTSSKNENLTQQEDHKKINNEALSSFFLILGSILLILGIIMIQFLPLLSFLIIISALIFALIAPTLTKSKIKKKLSLLLTILTSIALVIIALWLIISFLLALISGIDLGIGGNWNLI